MSSRTDPIERLRESFESIVPGEAQIERWLGCTRSSSTCRERSFGAEPLPWRWIVGSAVAAGISIAAVLVGPDVASDSPVTAGPDSVARDVTTLAGPMMTVATPDGTRLYLHIPATGVDLKASWEILRSAISMPFEELTGRARS